MSFARLHTSQDDDDDDLITEPSSVSSDINFGNPIFSSDKIQYSDDDNWNVMIFRREVKMFMLRLMV